MKFYHYFHCPFCQRVRLLLEAKGVDYESIVLSYADSKTPELLIGAKVLPIIDFGDGVIMGESIDLILEIEKRFPSPPLVFEQTRAEVEWAGSVVIDIPQYFDLVLPYYLEKYKDAEEFDEAGKKYFQESKESKREKSFEDLKSERIKLYKKNVLPVLQEIETKIDGGFVGEYFSVADCVLASDLNGLRLIDGLTLPVWLSSYIEAVEEVCEEDLLRVS